MTPLCLGSRKGQREALRITKLENGRIHRIWVFLSSEYVSTGHLRVPDSRNRTSGRSGASAWRAILGKSVIPKARTPAATGATRWRRLAYAIDQSSILTCRKRGVEAISGIILALQLRIRNRR